MSDEDKLFALILAMLSGGKQHPDDCVFAAQRIMKELKKVTHEQH